MRYGIFSDVHANLEALDAVLQAMAEEQVDTYLCLGDVVGYGANPQECIDRIKNLKAVCLAGNHDWAVIEKFRLEDFNPPAQKALLWTKQHLRAGDQEYLKGLPLIVQNDDLVAVHGTLGAPQNFEYLVDLKQAAEMFRAMERSVCFVGHTHVPFILIQKDQAVTIWHAWDVKMSPDWKYIVNVGSVGQPRDRISLAAYGLYDSNKKEMVIRRVNYDVEGAQQKIRTAGLPRFFADRLATGR